MCFVPLFLDKLILQVIIHFEETIYVLFQFSVLLNHFLYIVVLVLVVGDHFGEGVLHFGDFVGGLGMIHAKCAPLKVVVRFRPNG